MGEIAEKPLSWYGRANNNVVPVEDVNARLMMLAGELDDEQARATFAEFMYHNPWFMMNWLGGISLFPVQELVLKGWAANDYNLAVWGRGCSKSFLAALFILYWAVFNPGCRIVVVSFSFRASRRILEQCEKFLNGSDAALLRACFPDGIKRGTDEWQLKTNATNPSVIQSLPLGDGKKIRGIRADVLVVDEYGFLPENIIGEVLRPFLSANDTNKITEYQKVKARENELVAAGKMTDEQRTQMEDQKKVVFLSSASYDFEHLAKTYNDWTSLLTLPSRAEELKKKKASYFVSRFGYEAAPEGLLNIGEILEAKRNISQAMFDREYCAIFTSGTDGYFKGAKMKECSVPDGDAPCLELVGEPKARYVLGIDQSASGSETSDHFAMCLMKLIQRDSDGMWIGMVVHSYAIAGGNLEDHAKYLYYLMSNFNIVYIALDASGGSELEFVNMCNMSALFVDHKIRLEAIPDVDFNSDNHEETVKQIRKNYNRLEGRILHKQAFGSTWQRTANEYLQGCFDNRRMRFAGKIAANEPAVSFCTHFDMALLGGHEDFRMDGGDRSMTVNEFIALQDNLLDLTRNECAMIKPSETRTGQQTFDLPQAMKRTTGTKRVRKDSYSALLVCNWGVRMFVAAEALPVDEAPQDFPFAMIP